MKRFGLLLLLASACGTNGTDDTGTGQRSLCENESRATDFMTGLEQASDNAMFTLRFLDGSPTPPDRGDNTWTVEVLDATGTPMTELSQLRLKAWMPDHGHGTNPLWNDATPMTTDGQFELGPFDLFMGGFWLFTFEATDPGGKDVAEVGFCLEG